MKNKIITLIISLSLVCSSLTPCLGASQQIDVIEIGDQYDFLMLENNCRLDQYSRGKKFVLTDDIDLEGRTINGLASFSGVFDGQGYTISNFTFSNQSEACGLFRYIEKNGSVMNLKVETSINYVNPSTIIGGIAGVNYGVIDNCVFSGALKSSKTLGGITGSNAKTGIIKNSVNQASLISIECIGGIAGDNFGKIISCSNTGSINNESSWVDEQDDIDIEKLTDFSIDYQSGKNIGGIVGYNEGLVEDCCNDGTVGYFRSGDNVGGIAGYHEGQLKTCINKGSIFGKNNVGGITGHMQPFIEEKQGASLQPQIQQLHDALNKTIDDFSMLGDTLNDDVKSLTNQADAALKTADALTDELINVSNDNIDTLNDLSERIDYISEHLPSVTKEISNSLISFKTITDDFKKIKDDAPVLTEEDQAIVDEAFDRLEINADNLSQIASRAALIYDDIYEIITDDEGNTKSFNDLSSDEKIKIKDLSKDLMMELTDAGEIAADMISDLASISNIIRPYLKDSIDAWNKDLEKLFDDIDILTNHLQKAVDNTTYILDYCNSLDSLQAKGFSNSFSKKVKKLNDTLNLVNTILIRLNDDTSANSKAVENDMRAVNNQLNAVLNSINDYADSIENLINGDVYNDLSYSSRDYVAASRISKCTNEGVVDGCKNIGGVAGNMDVETVYSVEADKLKIGHEYNIYAVITGCINTGYITVKNLNGGGIVGCSPKGYISDCFSSGMIEGENASYLGGIAGRSNLRIDLSNSMSELSGKEYIGGIAGNAEEIHKCLSLARITKCEGRSGAILGADISENARENHEYRSAMSKRISNNYFCSKYLYGIDGVSYVNSAEPLSYSELCNKENAPDEFKNLKIIFLSPDYKVMKELPVEYGESLASISYPEIESESGEYISWDKLYDDTVDGNVLLRSQFLDYVTVVESEYTISGRPAGYISGAFEDSVKLRIRTPFCQAPDFINKETVMHLYDVELIGNSVDPLSVSTLRLYLGDANQGEAYILKDNGWEKVPSTKNGRYLEIDMQGNNNVFCIAEENSFNSNLLLYCSIAAILIICFLVVIINKHKKITGHTDSIA